MNYKNLCKQLIWTVRAKKEGERFWFDQYEHQCHINEMFKKLIPHEKAAAIIYSAGAASLARKQS